jgi:transposase
LYLIVKQSAVLWLISLGWTIPEAAKVIGINYDYAKEIVKGYNQQGEIAILRKKLPRKKRPSHALLNTLQLEELHLSLKGESPDRGRGERAQSFIMDCPKNRETKSR